VTSLGWSDAELDRLADKHVGYEIRMLTGQVEALERLRGRVARADQQALVEAPLIHLRLLNAFLLHPLPAKKHLVCAALWVWSPRGFLTRAERGRVSEKVAHISVNRLTMGDWRPREIVPLTSRCCAGMLEFVEHVEQTDHDRGLAFAVAKKCATRFMRSHT
jgi:hypothetical protein